MVIKVVHCSRAPRRVGGRRVGAEIHPGLCSHGLWAQKGCLFLILTKAPYKLAAALLGTTLGPLEF